MMPIPILATFHTYLEIPFIIRYIFFYNNLPFNITLMKCNILKPITTTTLVSQPINYQNLKTIKNRISKGQIGSSVYLTYSSNQKVISSVDTTYFSLTHPQQHM